VADAVRTVPGASNIYPEQVTSGQYLNIAVDRAASARYGIAVGEVQQVIETAVGETVLTTTIEGHPDSRCGCATAPRTGETRRHWPGSSSAHQAARRSR
jgi:Cu/Ag efflux pump CusA